jgi:hypothetical protein
MALPVAPPRFEPRPIKDGTGWRVLVAWLEGTTEEVDGFATELVAERWIETESLSWERAHRPR